jgi:hypothetical protein
LVWAWFTLDSSVVANLIILGLDHACSIQFLKCKDSAVLTACVPKSNSLVQQAVTDLPIQTLIPTKHFVETTTPTLTIAPTDTPNPLVEQARAFAEPILQAIANRPPDYQDDFSDPTSGWDIMSYAGGERSGKVGYEDGEYFLVADAASAQYRNVHSWLQIPGLSVSDFVMEFDFRFVSARDGVIYPSFRLQKKDVYVANIALDGLVSLGIGTAEGDKVLAQTRTALIRIGKQIHINIIAKGPQVALYLNDQPVLMAYDEFLDHGGVILGIWNGSSTPMQVNFDNFKVWNISNLP